MNVIGHFVIVLRLEGIRVHTNRPFAVKAVRIARIIKTGFKFMLRFIFRYFLRYSVFIYRLIS